MTLPSWATPVMDGNNTALADFSTSRIKWGTTPGDYAVGSKDIMGTGVLPANTVTGLSVGTTYYFVVYAVDTSGNLSSPSTEFSATAQ